MAYTDTIRSLPYAPRTTNASGFVPPMIRAMGHILYVTGCLADESITKTDEQVLGELLAALEHWDARSETNAVSTATLARATTIHEALTLAIEEYGSWEERNRLQNVRNLANRIIAYTCDLDRELLGLTGSDPGSSL
jgi:hypothetical protein